MADMDEAALDDARMAAVASRESAVNSCLASKDYAGAVASALENPPIGTKTVAIKVRVGLAVPWVGRLPRCSGRSARSHCFCPCQDKNAAVVLHALTSVKESSISGVVKKLSVEQQDVLMKCVRHGPLLPVLPQAIDPFLLSCSQVHLQGAWHANIPRRGDDVAWETLQVACRHREGSWHWLHCAGDVAENRLTMHSSDTPTRPTSPYVAQRITPAPRSQHSAPQTASQQGSSTPSPDEGAPKMLHFPRRRLHATMQ